MKNKRRRIGIFGDSIAWGLLDYERGGWADMVKTQKFSDDRLADTYNLGISSDTSQNVLDRFEAESKARRVDTLVFAIGINDSKYLSGEKRNNVSIEQYEKNLNELIRIGRTFSESITFVGITKVFEEKTRPIPWNQNSNFINAEIQKYDAVLKRVCGENGLTYIYMFDVLEDSDLPDGVHPDAAGHKKIFKRISEYLN